MFIAIDSLGLESYLWSSAPAIESFCASCPHVQSHSILRILTAYNSASSMFLIQLHIHFTVSR